MKKAINIHPLLKRMAGIGRMERGTICQLAGRPHYNHQTWRGGRNVSRYVRFEDVAALQEAIEGYGRYMKLAQQYADEVIGRTRTERAKAATARKQSTPRTKSRSRKRHRKAPDKDV